MVLREVAAERCSALKDRTGARPKRAATTTSKRKVGEHKYQDVRKKVPGNVLPPSHPAKGISGCTSDAPAVRRRHWQQRAGKNRGTSSLGLAYYGPGLVMRTPFK